MAVSFAFNFNVSAEDDVPRAQDEERSDAACFCPQSSSTGHVQLARQHVVDLQDEFYEKIMKVSPTPHSYCKQGNVEKVSAGLSYLKLDDLRQLCLQDTCKLIAMGMIWQRYNSLIEFCIFALVSSETVANPRICALLQLLRQIDHEHSDLLSGIYEGGLKIWECTFDLLDYMTETGVNFSGKRVLDLGCGAGLLGIHALLNGAEEVHFQDYNPEVIECLTTANVLTSCVNRECHTKQKLSKDKRSLFPSEYVLRMINKCSFFSGDWSEFSRLMHSIEPHPPLYDFVLTSETIYSTLSQSKLLDVLKQFTSPNGVILLAAKSHYFGVGGSVLMFKELVRLDGTLEYSVVEELCTGVVRQIVKLQHKSLCAAIN